MPNPQSDQRWFPSKEQLKDPAATERAFRQLLTQHYSLVDRFNELHAKVHEGKPESASAGSGPSNTKLLGLRVEPVDTTTLANGATLKFNKARGTFSFQ